MNRIGMVHAGIVLGLCYAAVAVIGTISLSLVAMVSVGMFLFGRQRSA